MIGIDQRCGALLSPVVDVQRHRIPIRVTGKDDRRGSTRHGAVHRLLGRASGEARDERDDPGFSNRPKAGTQQ